MTAIRSWPSTGCTEARHGSLHLACSSCANTHKWQRVMPPEVVVLAELVRAEHERHAKEMAAIAQRAARLRL